MLLYCTSPTVTTHAVGLSWAGVQWMDGVELASLTRTMQQVGELKQPLINQLTFPEKHGNPIQHAPLQTTYK